MIGTLLLAAIGYGFAISMLVIAGFGIRFIVRHFDEKSPDAEAERVDDLKAVLIFIALSFTAAAFTHWITGV